MQKRVKIQLSCVIEMSVFFHWQMRYVRAKCTQSGCPILINIYSTSPKSVNQKTNVSYEKTQFYQPVQCKHDLCPKSRCVWTSLGPNDRCIYLAIKPDVAFDWQVWHISGIYSTIFSSMLHGRCCAKRKNSHGMYSFRVCFCKFVVQAILSNHLVGGLLFQTGAKRGVTLQPNGEAKCDFATQGRSQG